MSQISYRELKTADEMDAAVTLQKIYWGEDLGALVPAHMLLSIVGYGGHVPAAFDGDRLVGLLIGFIGASQTVGSDLPLKDRLLVMSKRMVVLPDYRSHNIGTQLKLMQRDFAIANGIQLVTWTFDPLLARNAYLNIYKLGATGQRYEADYFGASQYAMISGDRLVINWWVNHQNTIAHIQGEVPKYTLQQYLDNSAAIINAAVMDDKCCLAPAEQHQISDNPILLLEIPAEFAQLQQQDISLAKRWREHIRQIFPAVMAAGYVVTNFIREGERTLYVFTRDDGSFRFMKA